MPDDISLSLKAQFALQKAGFDYTRSLGQNFLFDEELLEKIAALGGADEGVNVLEIGPGAGLLTAVMAKRKANVLAVEVDRSLESVLGSVLSDMRNVKIVFADALKTDLGALVRETFASDDYVICANLPYYITADFLIKAVTAEPLARSITLMLQKEAAQRVLSKPGEEGWCALSALVSFYCEGETLLDVPRSAFTPVPHVDSALIRLTPKCERVVPDALSRRFTGFIKSAFAMRRKTLQNNISSSYNIPKERIAQALTSAGKDPKTRGEALTLEELGRVFLTLKEIYEQTDGKEGKT